MKLDRCPICKLDDLPKLVLRIQCLALNPEACPEIRKGGGGKNLKVFFLFFNFKGGPAQKIAEKIKYPTKKVAKYI